MAKQAARGKPLEVITPPNVLKAKLRSDTTAGEEEVIRRAEAAMTKLENEYDDWMGDEAKALDRARQQLLKNPKDSELVGRLHRAALDVKGIASTCGYPLAARYATSLCRMIDYCDDTAPPAPLLNAHVDAIRATVARNLRDADDTTGVALAEELEANVEQLAPAEAGKPAPAK